MSDFKLYSVNWQDGMLITQQHLMDQERCFGDLIRWHALAAGDNYGLVRKSFSGKPALTLNLSLSGNRLRVEVTRCQALTSDGSFVEIGESTRPVVRAECEIHDSDVPVFIGVNVQTKHQVGDPDPGENVPRVPYLSTDFSLHLGAPPNLPEGSYLQIAELGVSGGEVAHVEGYYPPCLNLYADDRLNQKAGELRNRLETLLSLSTRAYMAVSSEGALSEEKTDLQVEFRELTQELVNHLASTLDTFVVGRNAAHPIQLVITFKRFLRLFSTSLNLHPGLKDYLNEKLFAKELNSDVRRFISSVDNFLLAEYDHLRLGDHIASIDEILDMTRSVLNFIGQVKTDQLGPQAAATDMLTYSGKTYRLVDHESSRLERVGELSYLVIDTVESHAVADAVILMTKDLFSISEWTTMQIRLGLNEARALGETDPVEVDAVAFGNKVALRARDMVKLDSVNQFTLMFRGTGDPERLSGLGKMDIQLYAV